MISKTILQYDCCKIVQIAFFCCWMVIDTIYNKKIVVIKQHCSKESGIVPNTCNQIQDTLTHCCEE